MKGPLLSGGKGTSVRGKPKAYKLTLGDNSRVGLVGNRY